MYQALYRKWRPKTFDDIVGQEQIVRTLKNEIICNKISHAYLLTGLRGTGKTSTAKILSKAVNCLSTKDGNPCNECDICKGIDNSAILDVSEIDAASNNGVENVRTIREEALFTPSVAKNRVYIIDEVHMLSTGAFNALLKILEEPPKNVIFILATTEVHKIPLTIISRCQKFDFYRISPNDIYKRLKFVCENENFSISDGAINLIAQYSDGAMRDALSLLDKCVNTNRENLDKTTVMQILGISESEYISNLTNFILMQDTNSSLKLLDDLYKKSKSMVRLYDELVENFRLILNYKFSDSSQQIDYKEKLANCITIINNLNIEKILSYIELLKNSYESISKGYNNYLEMQLLLIKLCNLELTENTISNLENRISNLEKKISKNIDTAQFDVKNNFKHNNSINNTENIPKNPDSQNDDLNQLQDKYNIKTLDSWPQILDLLLKNKNFKSLSVAFRDSNAYTIKNYVLINSKNNLVFDMLRNPKYLNEMRNTIESVTGNVYKLGPYNKHSIETIMNKVYNVEYDNQKILEDKASPHDTKPKNNLTEFIEFVKSKDVNIKIL